MNKYIMEYEVKGLDVWWVLSIDADIGLVQVGRGVISDRLWDEFLSLFQHENGVMSIRVLERRL